MNAGIEKCERHHLPAATCGLTENPCLPTGRELGTLPLGRGGPEGSRTPNLLHAMEAR